MDWLTVERGIWSVVFGAFLSFLAVLLVVPFGALAQIVAFCVLFLISTVIVYRFGFVGGIGQQTDEPGRLTLLFLIGFVIALVGHMATLELTNDGSILQLLGQTLSLLGAWWLSNWFVYRGGLERFRGRVTG